MGVLLIDGIGVGGIIGSCRSGVMSGEWYNHDIFCCCGRYLIESSVMEE